MFEEDHDDEEGFTTHVATEHNVLDYLSFLLHLEIADEFDYTPAEKYVADKLASTDGDTAFDWFPMRQAMTLHRKGNKSDMISCFGDISSKMDALEDALKGKFDTTHASVHALEGKFDTSVHALEGKFDTLEGKFDASVHGLEGKLDASVHALEGKFDASVQVIMRKLEALEGGGRTLW